MVAKAAKEAAKAVAESAKATAKEQREEEYRRMVLQGPVILLFEGEKASVDGAVKRLGKIFQAECMSVPREIPMVLSKLIRAQLEEEAIKRNLRLDLQKQGDKYKMIVEG
jgi:hypothetical protein